MTWELKEHTKAKHEILKTYLQSWFPIMGFTFDRIVYIDGFAGPGRYSKGEDGSPIYALKIARDFYHKFEEKLKDKKFVFYFIESNKEHFESLKNEVEQLSLSLPENFRIRMHNNTFADTMINVFENLDNRGTKLAPTFAFIDPFGTKGIPFNLIQKIMSYNNCEVFINHMYSGVLRSQHTSDHSELYGTEDWKEYLKIPGGLLKLYSNQLKELARVKYTRNFDIRTKNNAPLFELVYATNNIKGLTRMKEAMWKVDPLGNFTFRDTTNPCQIVLFEPEPDFSILKRMLIEKFNGQSVSISDIEEFVLVDTPFLQGHIKRKTLQPMLKAGEISVKRPPGKKSGFPKDTTVEFPSYSRERLFDTYSFDTM